MRPVSATSLGIHDAQSTKYAHKCAHSEHVLRSGRPAVHRLSHIDPLRPHRTGRTSRQRLVHRPPQCRHPPLAVFAAVAPPNAIHTVARLMGFLVLLGSCIRSVPQILRILRKKSAEGVSLTANYAELVAYSITIAYNMDHGYEFSTWGDTGACWLQDIVLIVLISKYRGELGLRSLAAGVAVAAGCWALFSGRIDSQTLAALQAGTILIIALGGRLPQILLNARRGNSGELSTSTCALNLAGNLARVMTTLVLTQDMINLAGAVVQGFLNAFLLWQCVWTNWQKRVAEGGGGLAQKAA